MTTGGTIVDEPVNCDSEISSQPGTPKTKVKFSCSYGGKIVLRPPNGHLKYVGGETRVISVPIDITFQDLMAKLTCIMNGEMILKYQIVPEELETLITVKTNEDLKLMFDECNSYENTGTSRLRTFLFPAKPALVDNGSMEPQSPIEQRYINAINGVGRPPTRYKQVMNTISVTNTGSPPTMSPPERCNSDFWNSEASLTNNHPSGKRGMQRVQSSPSLCNLGKQQGSPETSNFHHIYHKVRRQSSYKDHIPKSVIDPYRGGPLEKLMSVRYIDLSERERYQVEPSPQYIRFPSTNNRYHGGCTRFMQYDPYMRQDRAGSLPTSPQQSPLGSPPRKGWMTPPTGAY
ncbi:hypothetical protein LIER_00966 [Lithospermum erythrorhizon]|uniref:PB1 domain-containing protein n=1 Tax=Lithospermum erythrorhizon TaxID=34254 RepID=A0AAV3NJ61_LITER